MGSGKSHETLKRQWFLLNRMPRRGRKGTRFFQESLSAMGIDVSLRTIQRDLKELSRYFPLQSDEQKISGWKWAKDAPNFDIPGMDPHVALAFKMIDIHLKKMLPVSCLAFLRPYSKNAEEVLKKQAGGVAKWPKKIARISRYLTLEPPKIDAQILDAVYEGLLFEKQLEISYRNRRNNEIENISVHPLGLVFVDNVAYLVCTFWQYDDFRQIALHRIQSASVKEESCRIPLDFSLREYVEAGNFYFPRSKGHIQLKCLFDRDVAKHLEESPLSPTQSLTGYNEKQMLLTAEIEDTDQLRWWILGFGDLVEVLEPVMLRKDIKEIFEAALRKYK